MRFAKKGENLGDQELGFRVQKDCLPAPSGCSEK